MSADWKECSVVRERDLDGDLWTYCATKHKEKK